MTPKPWRRGFVERRQLDVGPREYKDDALEMETVPMTVQEIWVEEE